jgi:hypothetical protein
MDLLSQTPVEEPDHGPSGYVYHPCVELTTAPSIPGTIKLIGSDGKTRQK